MDPEILIAGTATLGKLQSARAIRAMLDRLAENGVRTVDTAPAYGAGCMERIVGEALAAHPTLRVNTKFGLNVPAQFAGVERCYFLSKAIQAAARKVLPKPAIALDPESLLAEAVRSLDRSYKRLCGRIDVLFAHEVPLATLNHDSFLTFIQNAKHHGVIRQFGVGGYRRQYETAIDSPIWSEIDVIQVESSQGQPLRLPPAFRGKIYLHGILAPLHQSPPTHGLEHLISDALKIQKADRLVVGFSKKPKFAQFLETLRSMPSN